MTSLRDDIAAYDKARNEPETKHAGEWGLFHAGQFVGVYADCQEAAGSLAPVPTSSARSVSKSCAYRRP